MNIERYTFAEKLHTDPEPSTLSRNLHSLTNSPKVLVLKLGSFIFTWVNLEKSSSQMRHSNAKKHIFCIFLRPHSSVTQSIGHAAILE